MKFNEVDPLRMSDPDIYRMATTKAQLYPCRNEASAELT